MSVLSVSFPDQIKMASVIITLKIMPSQIDVDLSKLEKKAKEKISRFGGEVGKVEIEPIAFGLKALKLIFVMDERIGGTDKLEEDISKINGVESVVIEDARRAIG